MTILLKLEDGRTFESTTGVEAVRQALAAGVPTDMIARGTLYAETMLYAATFLALALN